jgi:hypothetical protein
VIPVCVRGTTRPKGGSQSRLPLLTASSRTGDLNGVHVLAGRVLCFPTNGLGYLANNMGSLDSVLLRWLSANQISDLLSPAVIGYMPFHMPRRNRKFGKRQHSLLPGNTQDARDRELICQKPIRATILRETGLLEESASHNGQKSEHPPLDEKGGQK